MRISGYEWELLEDGVFLGRTHEQWYQIFLAKGEENNLACLLEFYQPPIEKVFDGELPVCLAAPTIFIPQSILYRCKENAALLLSLHWREFEEFTLQMLAELGYKNVQRGKGSKDEGVDVTAFIEHALGLEKLIVQCKCYESDRPVGKPIIKQLLWETDEQKATRGLLVTTSTLTSPAKCLVEQYRHKVGAMDINEIRQILGRI